MVNMAELVDPLPLVFSEDGFMSAADWVYFGLWLLVDLLNALMSVNICRATYKRHAARRHRAKWKDTLQYEAVSVVVPCYLPNEKAIIHSTIDHICSCVAYPGDVTLHVVYNTPKPLPAEEARLLALDGTRHGALGRAVRVHHVSGSASKAENLNHVIGKVLDPTEARYVAIFDADHHPDADCLSTLMAYLLQREVDCVQGSTYIRNRAWSAHAGRGGRWGVLGRLSAWLLANFIDAEFFVTYFVWMPAIELIGQTGFFGGSVALWRYDSLVNFTFSTAVQTEDIECSARAVLSRQKIRFCPEARSGELSPASLKAFWRQRQRWATGWDQVSIKYFDAIRSSNLSCREKAGLYYVFPGRWIACSIGLIAGVAHPIIAYVYAGHAWGPWLNAELLIGGGFYGISTCVMLSQLVFHQVWTSWPFVVTFYVVGPLYVLFQAFLVSYSLLSIVAGRDHGWVVTQRSHPSGPAAAAAAPAAPAAAELPDPPGPGARISPLSPFRKPTEPDAEPTLGFTLTRYYTVDTPDSVAQGLSALGRLEAQEGGEAPPPARPHAASSGAVAPLGVQLASGQQYQRML